MAISAVMFFSSNADVRTIYDAVVKEMGVRENPPAGLIHHWSAPVSGGLRVCDVWEMRDQFDRFAQSKIAPLASKHGLGSPQLEITPVHEMIEGDSMTTKGSGIFVEWDGNAAQLLQNIDEANQRMEVQDECPDGLVFHLTTTTPTGVRVIDHWESRADFERFVESTLGETLENLGMPQPRITYFDVYNSMDHRVATRL